MNPDQTIAEVSKVLGIDTRVKIIRLLNEKPLCVGALARRLDITAGAVSQHLRILKAARLVVPEKKGYFVHYSLDEKTLRKWKKEINKLFDV
jgi:DNA-binding transcriptional ArsR family regulator